MKTYLFEILLISVIVSGCSTYNSDPTAVNVEPIIFVDPFSHYYCHPWYGWGHYHHPYSHWREVHRPNHFRQESIQAPVHGNEIKRNYANPTPRTEIRKSPSQSAPKMRSQPAPNQIPSRRLN